MRLTYVQRLLLSGCVLAPVLVVGACGESVPEAPPVEGTTGGIDASSGSGGDATSSSSSGGHDAAMGHDGTSPVDASGAQDGTTGGDGGACGAPCGQGMVCCVSPLQCAGKCVPDCRIGGCMSGQSCDQGSGLCGPPDGGMMPPPDGGMAGPDGGMMPPPDGGMMPPPDGGMHPPPDGGMHPPPDGGVHPPPDGGGGTGPDSGSSSGGADASSGGDGSGAPVPPGIGTINGNGVRIPYTDNNVSIDDTTIALGGPGAACYQGDTRVYVWDGVSSWGLQQTIHDPNAVDMAGNNNLNCFGGSVAVKGDSLVIGAPEDSGKGAAYLYTRSGNTWTQSAQFPNTTQYVQFGTSVGFDGTHAFIGAPASVDSGHTYVGYVDILTQSGPNWNTEKQLTAPVPTGNACFGASLAVDGTRLVVGASGTVLGTPSLAGAVYSYQNVGTNWYYEAGAVGSDTVAADSFGSAIATATGTPSLLVVGAPGQSPMGAGSGAAYVFFFDTGNGTWLQNAKIFPPDGVASDAFGTSVAAVSATEFTVGAPGAGKIYLYKYAGLQNWTLVTTYTSCPVNVGYNMASWGSLVVTGKGNDVVLDTSLMPNTGCGGN